MLDIAQYFSGLCADEAREVIYFLSRYFKSAHFLESDGKDIFADVFDREPSASVRKRTIDTILKIEGEFGRPAVDFDDKTAALVLNKLADFEMHLDSKLSDNQISDASAFFSGLKN